MNKRKLMAFPYYGGKFSDLDFILSHLPNDAKHYVEVFGGSAAVLLNRDPAYIETYNDIDGDAVNFFRVLREDKDRLIDAVRLTPYAREELAIACRRDDDISDVERARRFYVRTRQTRGAISSSTRRGGGGWKYGIGSKSAAHAWDNSFAGLIIVAQRMQYVQIDNLDYIDVLNRYDSEDTLFYCDPPYVWDVRTGGKEYSFEMTREDHCALAGVLRAVKGRVVLSGYRSDLYDDLYRDWVRIEDEIKHSWTSVKKSLRQESIWTNFDPPAGLRAKQLEVFA